MANFLYDTGRQGFLTDITVGAFTGQIDWVADTIGVALVDTTTYTASQAADSSVQDILTADASAIFARTTLTNTTAPGAGVASADDAVFTAVPGPGDAEAVVIFRDNATLDADNVLIAYIDNATNLPVTLNGGDVTVIWDGGSGRIFKL